MTAAAEGEDDCRNYDDVGGVLPAACLGRQMATAASAMVGHQLVSGGNMRLSPPQRTTSLEY